MDLETINQFKDLTVNYVLEMQNAYNNYVEKREDIVQQAVDSMSQLHDSYYNEVMALSKGYLESLQELQEANQ